MVNWGNIAAIALRKLAAVVNAKLNPAPATGLTSLSSTSNSDPVVINFAVGSANAKSNLIEVVAMSILNGKGDNGN